MNTITILTTALALLTLAITAPSAWAKGAACITSSGPATTNETLPLCDDIYPESLTRRQPAAGTSPWERVSASVPTPIPEAQREAVLSAYMRLDTQEESRRQGFGLGLAIVQRVMALHRGRVDIGATDDGGAAITLSWPKATAQLP